jgi:hypothetical protein
MRSDQMSKVEVIDRIGMRMLELIKLMNDDPLSVTGILALALQADAGGHKGNDMEYERRTALADDVKAVVFSHELAWKDKAEDETHD